MDFFKKSSSGVLLIVHLVIFTHHGFLYLLNKRIIKYFHCKSSMLIIFVGDVQLWSHKSSVSTSNRSDLLKFLHG